MRSAHRKPDFGRLLTALTLQGEPDYVPLAELIVCGEAMDAYMGRGIATAEDVIDFQIAAGYDYVNAWPHYDWNPGCVTPQEGIRKSSGAFSDYTQNEVEIEWMTEGAGVITCMDDFRSYQFASPDDADYSGFEAYGAHLPDSMKLIATHGDIFRRVTELMGYETFCYALVEDPELVSAMFEKVGGIIYGLFERAVEKPKVGAVWYCDDIAYAEGLLCSPDALRKYAFPHFKKIAGLAHSKGLPIIYHSDGVLWEVMDDLIDDIGFDALHPIEPKAMDIAEVKHRVGQRVGQRVGRQVCLIGNIDVDLLARGTPEQVAELTRRRIAQVAPGGGYVLGSSNTIPNYCKAENFRAMVETARHFGRYPIAGSV